MTTVRRATPGDARAIAEVKIETWRATYVDVMPPAVLDELDLDENERAWRQWIASPDSATFVGEADGQIVGFALLGPCRSEDGIGELYAMYVRPEAWSTGAGLALMETGREWLAERWTEAVLWVAEENPRARRFYELCGWTLETTRVEEIAPGAEVPLVRYRLSGLGGR